MTDATEDDVERWKRELLADRAQAAASRLADADLADRVPEWIRGVLRAAADRLRGGEVERLHREAKRDVSQLMRVVEDLETVRVTCHNGHTSTLRELRDEEDCSAPCCPRSGCDECSFTFEPSDALSPTDGEEGERLDEVGRTPMEALEDRARSVADEIDRWGDVHPAHTGALVRVADIVLSAAPTDGEEGDLPNPRIGNMADWFENRSAEYQEWGYPYVAFVCEQAQAVAEDRHGLREKVAEVRGVLLRESVDHESAGDRLREIEGILTPKWSRTPSEPETDAAPDTEGREEHDVEVLDDGRLGKEYGRCKRCGKVGPPPHIAEDEWDDACDPSDRLAEPSDRMRELQAKIEEYEDHARPEETGGEDEAWSRPRSWTTERLADWVARKAPHMTGGSLLQEGLMAAANRLRGTPEGAGDTTPVKLHHSDVAAYILEGPDGPVSRDEALRSLHKLRELALPARLRTGREERDDG